MKQEQIEKFGPYEAPYWRRMWVREDAKQKRTQGVKLDYSQIVAAAYDYMEAKQEYRRLRARRYAAQIAREQIEKAYGRTDKYSAVLWGICTVTGIPQDIAIRAARIESKYYELHGGTLCVEYEKLIKTLM